jgi:hypothetical protein
MTQYTLTKKKKKTWSKYLFFFSFGWSDKYTILVKQGYLAPPVDYAIHAIFFFFSFYFLRLTIFCDQFIYIYRTRKREWMCSDGNCWHLKRKIIEIEYSFIFYKDNCLYICAQKEQWAVAFFFLIVTILHHAIV